MNNYIASVIIPVKDDPRVFSLIDQISRQCTNLIEILVVANGAHEAFVHRLKCECQKLDRATLMVLGDSDIASARNTGISKASGKFCVFLDSDCNLSERYFVNLSNLLMEQPDNLIGRGEVLFIPRRGWFSRMNCLLRNRSYEQHTKATYAPNLIIRSTLFLNVGLFQPTVGLDTEWGRRAKSMGYYVTMLADIAVYHADDQSTRKTLKTWFRYGVGRAYREAKYSNSLRRLAYYRNLFADSHLTRSSDQWDFKLFVGMYYLVRNAGVLYGVVSNLWRFWK